MRSVEMHGVVVDHGASGTVADTFNLATYAVYAGVTRLLGKLYSSEVVTYVPWIPPERDHYHYHHSHYHYHRINIWVDTGLLARLTNG